MKVSHTQTRSICRLVEVSFLMMSVGLWNLAARAQNVSPHPRAPDANDSVVETLVTGLNFPTAVAAVSDRIWVSEAGFDGRLPVVNEVKGNSTVIVLSPLTLPPGVLVGPITDLAFREGRLWIAHRQRLRNGSVVNAISNFDPDYSSSSFRTIATGVRVVPLEQRIRSVRSFLNSQRRIDPQVLTRQGIFNPIGLAVGAQGSLIVGFGGSAASASPQPATGTLSLVPTNIMVRPGTISGTPPPNQPPALVSNVQIGRDEERPIFGTSVIPPFTRPGTIRGTPPPNQPPPFITQVVTGRDEERPVFGTPVVSPFTRPGTIRGTPAPNQPPSLIANIAGGRDEERPIFGTSVIPPFTRPGTIAGPTPNVPPQSITDVLPGVDNDRFIRGASAPPGVPFTRPGTIRGMDRPSLESAPIPITEVHPTPDPRSPKQDQPTSAGGLLTPVR